MNSFARFMRDYSLAAFLLPLAVVSIVFGCLSIGPVARRLDYPRTEATVTRVELYEAEYSDGDTHYDATYTIYVKYTVDGVEYEEEYGIFPEMKVGQTVTINYNPDDHRDIGQPNSMLLPYGMIAGGVAALAVGIFSVIRTNRKNRALKRQEEEWRRGN